MKVCCATVEMKRGDVPRAISREARTTIPTTMVLVVAAAEVVVPLKLFIAVDRLPSMLILLSMETVWQLAEHTRFGIDS